MATLAVTGRADLTDAQWAVLEPVLRRGKNRAARRSGRNGSSLTGSGGGPGGARRGGTCLWPTGCGRRSMACSAAGSGTGPGQQVLAALQGRADAAGLITWDVSVDSTVARAHQHAAGARRRGDLQAEPPGGVADEPADHGLRLLPRRADHQGAPGLRAGPETAVHRGHRRAAGRQPAVPAREEAIAVPPMARARRGPARAGCWPTRPTAPAPTAPTCEDAGSRHGTP